MDDKDHTVSWQSAFFGIATLALNSITQEGGRVCTAPRAVRAGLLSSPCFCLVDMLYLLYRILRRYHSRSTTIGHAMSVIACEEHWPARVSFHELQDWQSFLAVHVILPVVAILQLVKLMGFEDLPWTRACAITYVVSYLLREGLYWTQRPHPSSDDDTSKESSPSEHDAGSPWILTVAGGLQYLLWVAILYQLAEASKSCSEERGFDADGIASRIISLCVFVLLAITVFILSVLANLCVVGSAHCLEACLLHRLDSVKHRLESVKEKTGPWYIFVQIPLAAFLITLAFRDAIDMEYLENYLNFAADLKSKHCEPSSGKFRATSFHHLATFVLGLGAATIIFMIFVGLFILYMFMTLFATKVIRRFRPTTQSFPSMSVTTFIMNLVGGLLYYRVALQTAETYKPPWTEELG